MQSALQTLPLWAQVALTLVPALSAVFAAIGLLLNVRQSRRTNAQARAALVSASLKGFADSEGIQRAYSAIQYLDFKYESSFHKSSQEQDLDKLLRHFANLALAWQAGLLSTEDVRPVQFYVRTVTNNEQVKEYIKVVEESAAKLNFGQHPFTVLMEMSEALKK